MKSNSLWDSTYLILKEKLRIRDVNNVLLPLVQLKIFDLLRTNDKNDLLEKWELNSESYNQFYVKLFKSLSTCDFCMSSICRFEDVVNAESDVVAGKLLKDYYDGLDDKVKSFINHRIDSCRFYSFSELVNFLTDNHLTKTVVEKINNSLNEIESYHIIDFMRELIDYGMVLHNYMVVEKQYNDISETWIFVVKNPYLFRKGKSQSFPEMACVWDFSEGYARCITKNGQWGYIREEDNKLILLTDDYVRVYDFHCGRAKVDIVGDWEGWESKKYACGYIDFDMNLILQPKYTEASDFKEGKASVKTEYCDDFFTIDVYGNVSPEFQKLKTKIENKNRILESELIKLEKEDEDKTSDKVSLDDEESVMRALSGGYGYIHGFD
ncbi:WG repeat-containing protein [Parabacteroides sp. FAFU027]|uniref:WG repeat-containing protein n=1 Tax=Parabacteroides sp. FAFU027 TaxID=2922715 RepID=UPI001FAEC119|nr:WG repeat-containing protein [Parabacteroides sp. FAFU027]